MNLQARHHQVHGVVVHHQDAQGLILRQGLVRRRSGGQRLSRQQRDMEPESGAMAFEAAHTNLAAMQFDQFFANGQPQARAAVGAGGLHIGMFKPPKNVGLLFQRNAAPGVTHLEVQAVVPCMDVQQHLALRREFERVAQEAAQDLEQALTIGAHPRRQRRVERAAPGNAFFKRLVAVSLQGLVHQGLQLEVFEVQHQLARLQLREVQDVVDHLQQMAGGAADVVHHLHLLGPIGQLLAQHAVEAQDRVHRGAQLMPHRRHKLVFVGLGL